MPTPTATEDPTDLGLFGPDSISWRVQADPVAVVGGLSSLFLQALHPLAMAGVFEHSSYDADFWPRFARTGAYVATVTYGSTAEVAKVAARVRGMHRSVQGTDPVTGQRYSAGNPELITWVHVTEVHGFLQAVLRGGMRLSGAEQDRYYSEQVAAARLLGAERVPATRTEVADYLIEQRPRLICSASTRNGARLLLAPPMPWRVQLLTPARPAWAALAGLGFCLLPAWARRMYSLPGLPTTDLGASVALRGLRAATLPIPERVRLGPAARTARARAVAI